MTLEQVWVFANSPLGVAIISGTVVTAISVLLTKQPRWRKVYEDNRGLFFDACRAAETAIPDDVPNKAAQKVDIALKFILKFEPALSKIPTKDLKRALTEAHDGLKE